MALNELRLRVQRILQPPVFAGDEEKTRIASLTNTILWATVVAVSLASIFVVIVLRNYWVMAVSAVSMLLPSFIALVLLRRGSVRAAAVLTVVTLWLVLAVMGFFFGGVINTSYTTMVILIIIAALLLGGPAGVLVAVGSFVAATAAWISYEVGMLPPSFSDNPPVNYWVTHTINYAIAAMLLYLAMGNLTRAIQRAQRLAAESEVQRDQLQVLVQERTQEAERNANYLGTTTAVAHESAAIEMDRQQLLDRVVNIMGEYFGFYHAGVYLLDKAKEWVVLRAASSEGGRRLVAQGHRLRVGAEGMVGDVARRGVSRVAADVRLDVAYRSVAELPNTRAELVLPLVVRGEMMGVLDIQSTDVGAFMEQDVQMLQALADQVAVAIRHAELFAQAQEAAEVERRAYGTLTGEAWQRLLRASEALGFYSDTEAVVPAGNLWLPEMKTALQTGSVVNDTEETRRLAVPVKVRDEVIGVIDFTKPVDSSAWTGEEIALVESLTEQLGVALDSARLYQDTRRRAAQEQLVGEVTRQMRASLDMEQVLRAAAGELREALGLERLIVRMGKPEPEEQAQ